MVRLRLIRRFTSAHVLLVVCDVYFCSYIPPLLWGKSGHIQTVVYGKKGRFRIRVPVGSRHSVVLDDGATLTYDMFEPKAEHESHRKLLSFSRLNYKCAQSLCPSSLENVFA